jgi:hypothetical protein
LCCNGFRSPYRYSGRYKVVIPMTSLTRANNGDWFARKAIPRSLRESYKAGHAWRHTFKQRAAR